MGDLKIRKTLMDQLEVTNIETIHSRILAWIFRLPDIYKNKTELLGKLFDLQNLNEQKNFQAYTEKSNIDLWIETNKYIFIIENKLKSSEFPGQTKKYRKDIKNPKDKKLYFGFLTLIKEYPKDPVWKVISYGKLLNALTNFYQQNSAGNYRGV
ncbi:MAG: PD-(D/E)XK nuclease family protein [Candidatus Aminicenantes bacterium]|nr:PD-(D/E)XK nuclease family protein [Candidatus Aminicenantes bacterium]